MSEKAISVAPYQMFFKARESGLVMLPKTIPKEFRRGPKAHVTHNLSMKFRNMEMEVRDIMVHTQYKMFSLRMVTRGQ